MSKFSQALERLGLTLPSLPIPQGSYVPAKRSGDWVFVSGQLPMVDGKLLHEGRVGRLVSLEQAQACAEAAFLNALAAFFSLGFEPGNMRQVVKLTGYVQCEADFFSQALVINGASNLSEALFGVAGRHARASVGVYCLPFNAPVEVEAVFEVG